MGLTSHTLAGQVINHGNFHVSDDADATHFLNTMGAQHAGDLGHNGFGRAPLEDCTGEIDDAGHALGKYTSSLTTT